MKVWVKKLRDDYAWLYTITNAGIEARVQGVIAEMWLDKISRVPFL